MGSMYDHFQVQVGCCVSDKAIRAHVSVPAIVDGDVYPTSLFTFNRS